MDAVGDIAPEYVDEAKPRGRSGLITALGSAAAALVLIVGAAIALPKLVPVSPDITATPVPTEKTAYADNEGPGDDAVTEHPITNEVSGSEEPDSVEYPGNTYQAPNQGSLSYGNGADPVSIRMRSDAVIVGRVTEILPSEDGETVRCGIDLVKVVKGDAQRLSRDLAAGADGSPAVYAAVPDYLVTEGEEYVFALKYPEGNADYTTAVPNGVYPADSETGRLLIGE